MEAPERWGINTITEKIEGFVLGSAYIPPAFFENVLKNGNSSLTAEELQWFQNNIIDFSRHLTESKIGCAIYFYLAHNHCSVRDMSTLMGKYDSTVKRWTDLFIRLSLVTIHLSDYRPNSTILLLNPRLSRIHLILTNLIQRVYLEKDLMAMFNIQNYAKKNSRKYQKDFYKIYMKNYRTKQKKLLKLHEENDYKAKEEDDYNDEPSDNRHISRLINRRIHS